MDLVGRSLKIRKSLKSIYILEKDANSWAETTGVAGGGQDGLLRI